MSDSTIDLGPDTLFVLACPVCQGQVAASGRLRGRDACCPLCASLFHVPFPRATPPPAPAPAELARPAPPPPAPRPQPAPPEPAPPAAAAREPPREPPREPAQEPNRPPIGLAEDWEGVITSLAPAVPAAEKPAAEVAASSFDLPLPETAEPADEAGVFSHLEGTPLDPRGEELAFQEPVRTMRVGGEVIEIRRLSPEERRRRRFRRNLLMIVVGISILLAIVALSV